jgi:uncharacterized protein
MNARQWALLLHFSLLAGFIIPLAGLIVPLAIWQVKKSELPELDAHGKIIANWIISAIIYGFVCFLLTHIIFFIGMLLLYMLGAICVIFPIIGGLKASNGELWKYPGSIQFIK